MVCADKPGLLLTTARPPPTLRRWRSGRRCVTTRASYRCAACSWRVRCTMRLRCFSRTRSNPRRSVPYASLPSPPVPPWTLMRDVDCAADHAGAGAPAHTHGRAAGGAGHGGRHVVVRRAGEHLSLSLCPVRNRIARGKRGWRVPLAAPIWLFGERRPRHGLPCPPGTEAPGDGRLGGQGGIVSKRRIRRCTAQVAEWESANIHSATSPRSRG